MKRGASIVLVSLTIVLACVASACGALRQVRRDATPSPPAALPTDTPQVSGVRTTAPAASKPSGQALDWIHTDAQRLVDESGRMVTLRGFVTITNYPDKSALNYGPNDYARMKAVGANYQSIRIGACAIGGWPGCQVKDSYLQQLDAMVANAKQAGMYSEFKFTMYDLGGQAKDNWTALWENKGGQQDAVINGWKNVWQRYPTESAIIGYDLLNEPDPGNLKMQEPQFVQQYLNPFYGREIDALRQIDQQHIAIFQPVIGSPPYTATVGRDQVAYAPHFYPRLREFLQRQDATTDDYPQQVQRMAGEAEANRAPLIIGEFGMPYNPAWDNQPDMQQRYQPIEMATASTFDQFLLSFSRPWWSDDKAGITVGNAVLDWALLQGRGGLASPERRLITDVLARPYPARVAGALKSFSFDFGTRTFSAQYTPSGSGATVFVLPRDRAFGGTFVVNHSGGVTLAFEASTSGVAITKNQAGANPSAFSWDDKQNALTISDWATSPVTLTVSPQ